MLKKITVLSLSALFLGCGFGFSKAAPASINSDEERVARIQSQEFAKYRSGNTKYKLNRVQTKINENEAEIKYLEAKRSKLDSKLALKLQLKEGSNSWFERVRLNSEIRRISNKIRLNEEKITSLKEKRNKLDCEFAIILQLREI